MTIISNHQIDRISDINEIDNFLLLDIWSKEDKLSAENLIDDIIKNYAISLSKYYTLDFKDLYYLVFEKSFYSISAFIDTLYRLKYQSYFKTDEICIKNYKFDTKIFFDNNFLFKPLDSSSQLRIELSNLILSSLGYSKKFDLTESDPEKISLETLFLPKAKKEILWKTSDYILNILQNSKYFIKILKNKLFQIGKKDLIKVGYINFRPKIMYQLPKIKWIRSAINEFISTNHDKTNMEKYQKLLKNEFIENTKKNPLWFKLFNINNLNIKFFELLISFIILKSDPGIFYPNKLEVIINDEVSLIQKNKIKAFFSHGGWFRSEYAIKAIAAKKAKIPVINFQNGGLPFFIVSNLKFNKYKQINLDINKSLVYKKFNTFKFPRKTKKKRLLVINTFFSNLYTNEIKIGPSSNNVQKLRQELIDILNSIDTSIEVYIKIKSFSYQLYKDYEYFGIIDPRYLKNKNVKIITGKNASIFFKYMDLVLTDSLSTSFNECISYGIPVIGYSDKEIHIPKEKYNNLYNNLLKNKILSNSKSDIIKIINDFFSTKYEWHNKDKINSINLFLKNFGSENDNLDIIKINNLISEFVNNYEKVN